MISQEEKKRLYKSLSKFSKKYNPYYEVVCFGNNDVTAETIKYLSEQKIDVKCIFDNAYKGENESGIKIINPEAYTFSEKTIVLIGSKYYNEMKLQLLGLGYDKRQIIKTINYADMFNYAINIKVFLNELCILNKAKNLYKKIVKKLDKNSILFISPAKSIGDIYLIIMYSRLYIEKKGIKHFQYVITGGAAEAICKACNVVNYTKVTMDEMTMLCKLVRFTELPDNRAIICNEIWAYTNLGKNIIGYGKYNNFSLCYKKSIFAMKEDSISFTNPLIKYDGDIHELFLNNHLVEGKTVLLAPYTNYLKPMPNELWIKLVDRLNKEGFCVCTNCASGNEKPISGSMPINLSFNEINDFLDNAGYFIGARSGLCDVISSSKADIHIIYQEHAESRFVFSHEYYSLKKMDLSNGTNVKEYILNSKETIDSIVNKIISNIL